MTINEAIAHAMKVAEQNDAQAEKWREEGGEEWGKTTTCRECAADHRQLAKWLIELKDLREENKVLMQECDRLIKEKGELLSKVSGGDVLRICQLEEQLQAELDNNHCLEIELKEAKRLLKAAMEDMEILYETGKDEGCLGIEFKWRYADEAKKLLNDEKINNVE
jgi:hypothetical protein